MQDKLAIMMAAIVPFDSIVKRLKSAIEQYELDKSDDNKQNVAAIAAILMTNHMADGSMEGAEELAKKFELWDRRNELFVTETN